MKTRFLDATIAYDGSQLRAHWILRHTGLSGDSAVAFRGPCDVAAEEMADLEDLLDGPGIAGSDMVHFLVEVFDDGDLLRAVYRQRLFTALAFDTLRALAPAAPLRRTGDDLFVDTGKLSISIATRSLVSTLIHFAVNVSNAGTPVETASLEDLGVDPRMFAETLLSALVAEEQSIAGARGKVRAKGES
jgi:uncharacterized protein